MGVSLKDAYRILGVDQNSNEDQVRKAYKKLALRYHPDKNNNSNQATLKFQEISEAYHRITSGEEGVDDDDMDMNFGMSEEEMFAMFDMMFGGKGMGLSGVSEDFLEELMTGGGTGMDFFDFDGSDEDSFELNSSFFPSFISRDSDIDNLLEEFEEKLFTVDKENNGIKNKKKKQHKKKRSKEKKTNTISSQEKTKMSLRIGSRVLVQDKYIGSVQFIGCTHYGKGEFIGVELDQPNGKNSGKIKGVDYFECKENHGLMVRMDDLEMIA